MLLNFYKSLSLPPLVLEDTRFNRYLSHDHDVTKIQNGGSCDVIISPGLAIMKYKKQI